MLTIGLDAQTYTFTSAGVDNDWNNSANWDQGSVPGVTDVIVIASGQTVNYDLGGDFNYTGTGFTINGAANWQGEKLKVKSNGVVTISSTGSLSNVKEFKFEQFSSGTIASGATVNVEKFKLKNFSAVVINASCITVTEELKNENVAAITGTGCIDFSGGNYTNSSSGGIFGCTSGSAGDCVNVVSVSTTITFNGDGDGVNWSDTDNWDGNSLPDTENENVTIPDGYDVVYDVGGNLDFENTTVFTVCGSIAMGSSHLHMKDNSSIDICSSGGFTGHEIKLEDDALGLITNGASVSLEQIEVKNNGVFTINAQCVTITDELKNKNSGTISGSGCFDYSGSTFENTGTGGIFNCFQSTYGDCNFPLVALPVELREVSVRVVNNEVIVDWETLAEVNNSHFEIWAGTDESHFTRIKTIRGQGNSVEPTKYAIGFEPIMSGVLYVRLVQVDFSGDRTNYDILSVIYSPSLFMDDIMIFPNPAKDLISFGNLNSNEEYNYQIFSSEGVLLKMGSVNLANNSVEVFQFSPGSFTVVLTDTQGNRVALRFLKL